MSGGHMSVDFILNTLGKGEPRNHGEPNQEINLHCRSLADGLRKIKDRTLGVRPLNAVFPSPRRCAITIRWIAYAPAEDRTS